MHALLIPAAASDEPDTLRVPIYANRPGQSINFMAPSSSDDVELEATRFCEMHRPNPIFTTWTVLDETERAALMDNDHMYLGVTIDRGQLPTSSTADAAEWLEDLGTRAVWHRVRRLTDPV